MRFRHPEGVRLALTSGHVAHVGTDWTEIAPIFHHEALANRCQCDQMVTPDVTSAPTPKASEDAQANVDEATVLRAALIRMIERHGPDDFTAAGLPNQNTLRKESGISVDRELAFRLFHELEAEAAATDEPKAA